MASTNGAGLTSAVTDSEARIGATGERHRFSRPSLHKAQALPPDYVSAAQRSEQSQPHSLDLLFERSCVLAHRVRDGSLQFIDGVDMAYSAAQWSGLVDRFGDDVVQLILADAFTGARS